MSRKLLPVVLILSLVSVGWGESHQHMLDRVTASTVHLTAQKTVMTWMGPMTGTSHCTGFVVAPERVLTAEHCLGENIMGDGIAAQVLKVDPYYDLALLAVPTAKVPLSFRDKNVSRGEAVTGIGYGFGLSAVTPVEALVMLVDYQIPQDEPDDAAFPPYHFYQGQFIGGMSGGPVVDANGRIVGVVQQSGEGVGVGVGALIARAFLVGAV